MNADLSLSSTLDSTLQAADAAAESVRHFVRDAGFSDNEVYFLGLAAHEILVNSVVHGNRYDPNKKVTLRLSFTQNNFVMEVLDEGGGFQLDAVPDPRKEENLFRVSGRGIAMARAIVDEFAVQTNPPHGTLVRMLKKLKPQSRESGNPSW